MLPFLPSHPVGLGLLLLVFLSFRQADPGGGSEEMEEEGREFVRLYEGGVLGASIRCPRFLPSLGAAPLCPQAVASELMD